MPKSLSCFCLTILVLLSAASASAQPVLRQKIGQMLMVTFTGDSLEKRTPSLDTLSRDLAEGNIGGVILFTWSGNLRNPGQIRHLTHGLQLRSATPLLIAVDQEGGRVARLNGSNGFAATPTAYQLGTILRSEQTTRDVAALMAGWLDSCGINVNLAPVVDVNVNPASPAIGALERSFSRHSDSVSMHARWFIEEFRRRGILTALKHFPGHGSATTDSHLGFTDITRTWSPVEMEPFRAISQLGLADLIMPGHLFNANIDSSFPATLSPATLQGVLRGQLGFSGILISDEMSMQAISDHYGLDTAAILAVNAGVEVLLYNKNILPGGRALAPHLIEVLAHAVEAGRIPPGIIDAAYAKIMAAKSRLGSGVVEHAGPSIPLSIALSAYPNPFNHQTTLLVRLDRPSSGRIRIVDVLGRAVLETPWRDYSKGEHRLEWNAGGASSGTYFVLLETDKPASTPVVHKAILVK